ncbi:BTB/POZ-like protein [Corchorus capsularis]|uniref:BTB/POZ-like protein n=1 Tax=Corchorus capsularis TaxID=210143 RepID=A0A1R3IAC4_COCAP|nr:BTB/POZ-like protein [Corchorus capsularis]
MPSFGTQCLEAEAELNTNVVAINVGGQIFQTTKQTLTQAGPKSFLSQLAETTSNRFVDRDPEYFSLLLSLLRSGTLPSKVKDFDLHDLIEESRFYGLESLLNNSLTNPSHLDAFALQKSLVLHLNGRDSPSTIATTPSGSLHVAHGSKITSFDWSLSRKSTILTQFTAVDSLLAITPDIAAAGATDFAGLQILDLQNGSVKKVIIWENVTRSGSMVQAIGSSPEFLFTSFESGRRNSNSIMVYDLNTLNPVIEIGHNEIFGAELDSAIPATKLRWVSGYGLVMAAGSHSGLSGVSGNIRFWDIRSGNVVFELKEKVDCFSDICVSDNLNAIFKVGVNSGEVFYADFRSLGNVKENGNENSNPWICLGDRRKVVNGKKEGYGCKIESHGNQVFCSKGGDIELWSEVAMGSAKSGEGRSNERVFRKNLMGRVKDLGGLRITNLAFGGNKMFVTRKDQQAVEVWQGSTRGF